MQRIPGSEEASLSALAWVMDHQSPASRACLLAVWTDRWWSGMAPRGVPSPAETPTARGVGACPRACVCCAARWVAMGVGGVLDKTASLHTPSHPAANLTGLKQQ